MLKYFHKNRITEDELTPLRAQLEEILGKINEQVKSVVIGHCNDFMF